MVPGELLGTDGTGAPAVGWILHAVVHNPILLLIWALGERGMSNTVSLVEGVLVENAALVVLTPISSVHWVISNKFELTKAVVTVVGSGSAVDDELLASVWVGELLRAFVRSIANVLSTSVWGKLPGVVWGRDDLSGSNVGFNGPWVAHLGDA